MSKRNTNGAGPELTNLGSFLNRISEKHEKGYDEYDEGASKEDLAKTWLNKGSVGMWRFQRMYRTIDPLLCNHPDATWLTVGDGRFGKDALYIREKGVRVLPTDISETLLKKGKEMGLLDDYRVENAESLSFDDEEFDFVFCKEAYHHFPRPMIALYEMLRVAKTGVVLIEPNDPYERQPLLSLFLGRYGMILRHLLRRGKTTPKNHTYETNGNYVYTISEREIEKVALGINCGAIGFKGTNDFYEEGVEFAKAVDSDPLFRKVKRKIRLSDLKTKLRLKQYDLLTAVVFKQRLAAKAKKDLLAGGFNVIDLPANPYLS